MTNPPKFFSRNRILRPSRHARMAVSALVLALAGGGLGCEDDAAPTAPDTRVQQGLQEVLDRAVTKPGVLLPGAITSYRDATGARWSGSAGLADREKGVPMRAHDRFRAGSVLKTFLATVALQHVEEGRLALDQTLPRLVPHSVTDRIANADRITLRMLLGHTSGIPDWVTDDVKAAVVANPGRIWSDGEAIDIASRLPASFAPGTSWEYSNTNYTLVGMVLEQAGGQGWRAQVRERVIARLALASTHLPEPGDRTVPADLAHGYSNIGGAVLDLSLVDSSMAGAAGGHALMTTAEDLARFIEALLASKLFAQPTTLTAMTTMIEAPHQSGLPYRYGLGLEAFQINGATVIGHGGSTAGYAVMMFRIPDRDATLVTAVNTQDLFVNALEVFVPSLEIVAR